MRPGPSRLALTSSRDIERTTMDEPRISVLIPVYNGERYLAEAIVSTLSQRPQPAEVIVIDDGSTDGSADVARDFGPPLRCIAQANGGIGHARNAAVAASGGEYIAFLDADDVWTLGALGSLLAALIATPEAELVFGHTREFVSASGPADEARRVVARPGLLRGLLNGTFLVRRPTLDAVGTFREDVRSGELIDWIARFREQGRRELLIDDHVLWRRIHSANHGLRCVDARSDYALVLKSALDRRRAIEGD